MPVFPVLAVCLASAVFLSSCSRATSRIQSGLDKGSGVVTLPPGIVELDRALTVPASASGLDVVGSQDSVLKATPQFQGRALIHVQGGSKLRFRNFTLDGGRADHERPAEIPPAASPFAIHFQNNGILIESAREVSIAGVQFREIASFPILASQVKGIRIEGIRVEDCGGRNAKGRNNTTGGVLLEEGTDDFEVRDSVFRRVLGNALWTHSTFQSRRNFRGLITGNRFEVIGRDAVQIGHANSVRVESNSGRMIGYPPNIVDVENGGTPVAIDTSGKFDEGMYTKNRFEEVNGKCIDLDGFHDGQITGNVCINRGTAADYPNGHYGLVMNNANKDMQSQLITVRDNTFDGFNFGGIFVIGKGHRILGNKLLNLNRRHCQPGADRVVCPVDPDEPDLLHAGIYLGYKAERLASAEEILIEDNEISGFQMKANCVAASPKVDVGRNTVRNNRCSDVP